jgi:hypothetical protein
VLHTVPERLLLFALCCRAVSQELLTECAGHTSAHVSSCIKQEVAVPFTTHRLEFQLQKQQHLAALITLYQEDGASSQHHLLKTTSSSSRTNESGTAAGAAEGVGTPRGGKAGGGFLRRGGREAGKQSITGSDGAANSSAAAAGAHLAPSMPVSHAPAPALLPGTGSSSMELLSMMAACLAYWSLAYHRVADLVPLAVSHHMMSGVSGALRSRLASALLGRSASGPGGLASLMEEPPAILKQRRDLESRQHLLEQCCSMLKEGTGRS